MDSDKSAIKEGKMEVEECEDFLDEDQRQMLITGIAKISRLRVAEAFRSVPKSLPDKARSPVDVVRYPHYLQVVACPMDLSTITARLENRYYRRIEAVEVHLYNQHLFSLM